MIYENYHVSENSNLKENIQTHNRQGLRQRLRRTRLAEEAGGGGQRRREEEDGRMRKEGRGGGEADG